MQKFYRNVKSLFSQPDFMTVRFQIEFLNFSCYNSSTGLSENAFSDMFLLLIYKNKQKIYIIKKKEDFYDFLIRRELPEGEIIQARLIGNLLLKYPLGISDSWYRNRINHMIETGEIEVVKEADEIFRRSIRKEQ